MRSSCGFILPVGFAEVLEVVHVAAGRRVLSVFSFSLLGVSDLQQVSVILHHIIAFLEAPSSKHRPALSFYVLHLQRNNSLQVLPQIFADD